MADNKLTIQQTFEKLKTDFLEWATNNLNKVVPITRKVNGHELREDITLTANDIDFNAGEGGEGSLQVIINDLQNEIEDLHNEIEALHTKHKADIEALQIKHNEDIADLTQQMTNMKAELKKLVTFEWNASTQTLNIKTQ